MTADFRFAVVFNSPKQLRHCTLESIRKPHGIPLWFYPLVRILFASHLKSAGSSFGVGRPSYRTFCHTIRTFNTPFDIYVFFCSLSGPRPHIVKTCCHQSVCILKCILTNPVNVLKLRSRILPGNGCYFAGITKQVPESIDMMNSHIKYFDTVIFFQEFLPMRNGPHLNRCQYYFAQQTLVKNGL